ncbi:hypothetical protein [Algoriphagus litoralis]|uniref:hypothetical protein n=1 Tax=Algoriphagus litoralis TaxID=2202829 RepID=UPI000DB9B2EE|nr:hypothetical protein [Algoriphagus litoralis]
MKIKILFVIVMLCSSAIHAQQLFSSSVKKVWDNAQGGFSKFRGDLLDSNEEVDVYAAKQNWKFAEAKVIHNKALKAKSVYLEFSPNASTETEIREELERCVTELKLIATKHQLKVVEFGEWGTYSFFATQGDEQLPCFTIAQTEGKVMLLISDALYSQPASSVTNQ